MKSLIVLCNQKINGITDERWTYKDMLDQTKLMARVLHGAGAKQNDVVSIIAENRLEYPAVVFGAFYLSVVVAPASVTYTERKSIHSFISCIITSQGSITGDQFKKGSQIAGFICSYFSELPQFNVFILPSFSFEKNYSEHGI